MHPLLRRDIIVITLCALALLFMVELKYEVSTQVFLRSEQPRSAPQSTELLEEPEEPVTDEYGDVIEPIPLEPVRSKHGSSFKHKGHKGHGKSALEAEREGVHVQDAFDRRISEGRLIWGSEDVPLTSLVRHAPGFTIMENVYLLNGTLYLVQSETRRTAFPEVRMMISNGGNQDSKSTEPTDTNLRIITTSQAKSLFGTHASRIDGTSFIAYDHDENFSLYQQFSAQILLSLWRAYSSLDPSINQQGRTRLSTPRRLMAPHVPSRQWRDYAHLNQYVFHAALPSTGIELQGEWLDRADIMRPYIMDRIVLADRTAAARADDGESTGLMAFQADKMPKSEHWWTPIRNNVLKFTGIEQVPQSKKPVVTYVSRQKWGRRMLKPSDHHQLEYQLGRLRDELGWEVNIVAMEDLTRRDQIRVAARTTIFMGVHGTGMAHHLWMQPSKEAAVIEFFPPKVYRPDFEYTSRMLGIKHYSIWNDKSMSYPDLPSKSDIDDSLSIDDNEIPLDAAAVISLCMQHVR